MSFNENRDGNQDYLIKAVIPTLLPALTQLALLRPKEPLIWLGHFILQKSGQCNCVVLADGTSLPGGAGPMMGPRPPNLSSKRQVYPPHQPTRLESKNANQTERVTLRAMETRADAAAITVQSYYRGYRSRNDLNKGIPVETKSYPYPSSQLSAKEKTNVMFDLGDLDKDGVWNLEEANRVNKILGESVINEKEFTDLCEIIGDAGKGGMTKNGIFVMFNMQNDPSEIDKAYKSLLEGFPKKLSPVKSEDSQDIKINQLPTGTKVKARFGGGNEWYSAKISAVHGNTNTYDLRYDDGDTEKHVERKYIISNVEMEAQEAKQWADGGEKLSVGCHVECLYDGKDEYFKGTITSVNPGNTFNIDYDDGDKEVNVARKLIKLMKPPLKVGMRVEAKMSGAVPWEDNRKFFPGKVKSMNGDGTFNIVFDDGDETNKLERKFIKILDEDLPSPSPAPDNSIADTSGALFSTDPKVAVNDTKADAIFTAGDLDGDEIWNLEEANRVNQILGEDPMNADDFKELCLVVGCHDTGGITKDGVRKMFSMQEGTSELDNAYKLLVLSSSKAGQYIEGAKVEAQFGSETGEWFKGKIDRVNNDGTFDILYDDGDRERVVQKHRIRLKETANTDISSKDAEDDINSDGVFKEGDAVEAMYGDGEIWYPATITKVKHASQEDITYDLLYNDKDTEIGVIPSKIRATEKLSLQAEDKLIEELFTAGDRDGDKIWNLEEANRVNEILGEAPMSEKDFEELCVSLGDTSEKGMTINGVTEMFTSQQDTQSELTRARKLVIEAMNAAALAKDRGYTLGDRIEARFGGDDTYYPGIVQGINDDGTFEILYDDGDSEPTVKHFFMRHQSVVEDTGEDTTNGNLGTANTNKNEKASNSLNEKNFVVGTVIEGNYNSEGKWFKGKVVNVNEIDGSLRYDITYDDGDIESDVSSENIRYPKLGGGLFTASQKVECKYQGSEEWYSASVLLANTDGTYNIAFDDGDREDNVPSELIRALDDTPEDNDSNLTKDNEKKDQKQVDKTKEPQELDATPVEENKEPEELDATPVDENKEPEDAEETPMDENKEPEDAEETPVDENKEPEDAEETPMDENKEPEDAEETPVDENKEAEDAEEAPMDENKEAEDAEETLMEENKEAEDAEETSIEESNQEVISADEDKNLEGMETGKGNELEFSVGDLIEGQYDKGPEWFPGSISAVNNDGTYNIKYSDGDSEMNVLKEYIRVPLVGGGSFSEGDPIEALFRGESEWFPGMISKVHDNNTYDIMYYDGDIEEQVASTLIRMSDNNAAKAAQTAVANSPKASQVPPDADEESEDDGPLLEGSAVEALSGGNWVSGQIKNVREKKVEGKDETTISTFTYDILFDDGERESKMDVCLYEFLI